MNVNLHLTTACSLRCDYCPVCPRGRPPATMTRVTARKALVLAKELSGGKPCAVGFFGGEPLLKQELIAGIIKDGRELGNFHWRATTNGLHLDEAFLELCEREGLLLAMSFDGTAAAHDAHRRLPDGAGSHAALLPRLRLLIGRRPYASVIMVVSPDTVRHYADSVETLIVEEGVRSLVVSLDHGAAWRARDYRELAQQYRRLGRRYLAWTREGRKFSFAPFESKIRSHVHNERYRADRCELAEKQFSVATDGAIYPCVQFVDDPAWRIGHVDSGIDDDARSAIRERGNRPKPTCEACELAPRCHHTCGCINRQATGAVDRVPESLCRHERILIAEADRVAGELWEARNPLFVQKHYNLAYPVLSVLEDGAGEE